MRPSTIHRLEALYALGLRAYPAEFRERFGPEMQQLLRDRCREFQGSPIALTRLMFSTLADWGITVWNEHADTRRTKPERNPLMYQRFRALPLLIRSLVVLGLLMGAGLLISATSIRAFVIPTGSMEASLLPGDHMLITKFARDYQRGDLIVFHPAHMPETSWVKRVIGVPGDRIRIQAKQVYVNGERILEPYASRTDQVKGYMDMFPGEPTEADRDILTEAGREMLDQHVEGNEVVVPEGAYFVLGDNRDLSIDSRYTGFVYDNEIVGHPWFIYASFNHESGWRWNRTFLSLNHPDDPAQ